MVAPISAQNPAALAIAGCASLSYGELSARALAVGDAIRARLSAEPGARGGDRTEAPRIVLAARGQAAFAAGLLGAWQAGCTVELPPNVQPATLAELRAHAGAFLHDVDGEPGLHLGEISARAHGANGGAPGLLRDLDPDAPIVALHTSGTTLSPRRVVKTAAQVFSEVEALAELFGVPGQRVLATVPLLHYYGLLFGLLVPLASGGAVVEHRALLAADVARALGSGDGFDGKRVDLLVSTPAHLRALAHEALPQGLRIASSGARMPGELHLELAIRHNARVTDVLGSSETGGIASRTSPLARWTPLPGVVVEQAEDERLRVTSPWAGTMLADDRVVVRTDGTFEHLGRTAGVVKVGGKRLELDALEQALLRARGVSDAAVLAKDHPRRGALLYAAVSPADVDEGELRRALVAELDPVLVPRRIVTVAHIPRTESGKARRDALEALFGPVKDAGPTGSLDVGAVDERGVIKVHIPRDYVFFQGHFPSAPILPGIVQLTEVVLPIVRGRHPGLGALVRVRRGRFRRPILPDETVEVTLSGAPPDVRFELRVGPALVASGVLSFEVAGENGAYAGTSTPEESGA